MPFPESTESASRHVPPERLFKVAARGESFHAEEFQHLKNCVLCQERFQQFVLQKPADGSHHAHNEKPAAPTKV